MCDCSCAGEGIDVGFEIPGWMTNLYAANPICTATTGLGCEAATPAAAHLRTIRDSTTGAKLALVIVDSKVTGDAMASLDLAVAGASAVDLLLANLLSGGRAGNATGAGGANPGFRGHIVLGIASLASKAYLVSAVARARATWPASARARLFFSVDQEKDADAVVAFFDAHDIVRRIYGNGIAACVPNPVREYNYRLGASSTLRLRGGFAATYFWTIDLAGQLDDHASYGGVDGIITNLPGRLHGEAGDYRNFAQPDGSNPYLDVRGPFACDGRAEGVAPPHKLKDGDYGCLQSEGLKQFLADGGHSADDAEDEWTRFGIFLGLIALAAVLTVGALKLLECFGWASDDAGKVRNALAMWTRVRVALRRCCPCCDCSRCCPRCCKKLPEQVHVAPEGLPDVEAAAAAAATPPEDGPPGGDDGEDAGGEVVSL